MAEAIRFLLDGEVREVAGLDPNTTVLEWLRGPAQRMGTKEGCAEGDCGACTVIVAERGVDDTLARRTVNACLAPIATLDGRQLVTVESLRDPGSGALHPAQAAMVEHHGSQCGFCTPGFVMSLAALHRPGPPPDREPLLRALAGNLCRCTGYRPILDAAAAMFERASGPDRFARAASETAARLSGLVRSRGLAYEGSGRRWFAPRSLEELRETLRVHPDATLLGGASDLGLRITKEHKPFDKLVWLGEVRELRGVRETAERIDIGGVASWAEAHAPLARFWPGLDELIARFAGLQIRNVATVAGNLANASPIGDGAPALLALGAELELWRDGATRTVPLDEFFRGYRKTTLAAGEIILRIRLLKPGPSERFAAYKVSKRFDSDISAVCACFAIDLDADGMVGGARLAYGGMAATPARARRAEAALAGRRWDLAAVHAALEALAQDFNPIDDLRATCMR